MKKILTMSFFVLLAGVIYWQANTPADKSDVSAGPVEVITISGAELPQIDWTARLGEAWKQWNAEVVTFKQLDNDNVLVESNRYQAIEKGLPLRTLVGEQLQNQSLLQSNVDDLELAILALVNIRKEIELLNISKLNADVAHTVWQQHATEHQLGLSQLNISKINNLTKSIEELFKRDQFIQARYQYEELDVYYIQLMTSSSDILAARKKSLIQRDLWKSAQISIIEKSSAIEEAVSAQKAWLQANQDALSGDFLIAQKNYEIASGLWVQAVDKAVLVMALPEMIDIPGGVFEMGDVLGKGQRDEKPAHKVNILPFAMSSTSITFAQFDVYSRLTNSTRVSDEGWGRDQRPVINVSWQDAQNYTRWLSKITELSYRLPSEAEWEYAARAGKQYQFGIAESINNKAHCEGCDGWDQKASVPVASFAANAFGLYDMQGNVWQWVLDCYDKDYKRVPVNGKAFEKPECGNRVARGGSWQDFPNALRVANRTSLNEGNRNNKVGFRVVLEKPVQLSGAKIGS